MQPGVKSLRLGAVLREQGRTEREMVLRWTFSFRHREINAKSNKTRWNNLEDAIQSIMNKILSGNELKRQQLRLAKSYKTYQLSMEDNHRDKRNCTQVHLDNTYRGQSSISTFIREKHTPSLKI